MVDVLSTIALKTYAEKHSSTKITPFSASSEKTEKYVYRKLLDKRKKVKLKPKEGNVVRTAGLQKTFSKGDTTILSYNLYEVTKIKNHTIPNSEKKI